MKRSKRSTHKPTKDFSFAKFFNPSKSPHTHFDEIKGEFTYVAKNRKFHGKVVWPSRSKGTHTKKDNGVLVQRRRASLTK